MPQLEPVSVQNQFPDYPLSTLPDLSGFVDCSWHNDTCPSWNRNGYVVWIDWPDPSDREDPEGTRFIVCKLDDEGCLVDGPPELETDEWGTVQVFFN